MSFVIGFVLGAAIAAAVYHFGTHPEDRTALLTRLKKAFGKE